MADLSDLETLIAKSKAETQVGGQEEEFVQPLISEDFVTPKDEARVKGISLMEEVARDPQSLGDVDENYLDKVLEIQRLKENVIGIEDPELRSTEIIKEATGQLESAMDIGVAGVVGGGIGRVAPSLLFPKAASKYQTLIPLLGETAGTNLATQAYSQDFTNDRPIEEILELALGTAEGSLMDLGVGIGAKAVGGIGKGISSLGESAAISANRQFDKGEVLKDVFPVGSKMKPEVIQETREKLSNVMERIQKMGNLTPDNYGRYMPDIYDKFKTLQKANNAAYSEAVDAISKLDNQKIASINDLFDWKSIPEQESLWQLERRSLKDEVADPLTSATKAKSFEALMKEETFQKAKAFQPKLNEMSKILGSKEFLTLGITEDTIRKIDPSRGLTGLLEVVSFKDATPKDLQEGYQGVLRYLDLENEIRNTKIFDIKELQAIRSDFGQRSSSEFSRKDKGTLNEGEAKRARALYQSSAMISNRIEERVKELQSKGVLDQSLADQFLELKKESHEIFETEKIMDEAWRMNDKYVPEGIIAKTTGYASALMRRDPVGISVRVEDIPTQQRALKALANWSGGGDGEAKIMANLFPTTLKVLGSLPTETAAFFTPTNINSISHSIEELNKTISTISADPNPSPSDIKVLSSLKSLQNSLDGIRQKAFEGVDLPEEDQENLLVAVHKDPFAKRVLFPATEDVNPFAKGLTVVNNRLPDLRDREIYVDRISTNDGLSNVQKARMIKDALESGKISQATAYQFSLQKRFESGYSRKPKQESSGSAYDRSIRNQISNLLEAK